jgi:hypothetical protein
VPSFYRFADALSSDLVGYMSPINTLVLFTLPRICLLFVVCPLRSLAYCISYFRTDGKTSIYAYSFHFSVDQPSRQYHHQLHHPMDRFKRRGQESSSHPQDHALSLSQSQQKLPPFRDVHHCPSCPNLFCADSGLDHSRASPQRN